MFTSRDAVGNFWPALFIRTTTQAGTPTREEASPTTSAEDVGLRSDEATLRLARSGRTPFT
jgi:hypothetical protein